MLRRLAYVSTVSPEASERLPSTVEDILAASVANNRRDGITGFLLCDGCVFAQALEGPPDRVEACFARIVTDGRNLSPTVRLDAAVAERAFPRWSMCGLTLSPRDDALLHPPDIQFDVASASPGLLWQFLTGLALRHALELDAAHRRLLAAAPGR